MSLNVPLNGGGRPRHATLVGVHTSSLGSGVVYGVGLIAGILLAARLAGRPDLSLVSSNDLVGELFKRYDHLLIVRETFPDWRVLGMDITLESVEIRRLTGYLPGGISLYDSLTGEQVLDYLVDMQGREPRRRAELCDRLELPGSVLRRRVRDYSRGMRQKIGVVQALQHDPELAILDDASDPSELVKWWGPEGFTARGARIEDVESALALYNRWSRSVIGRDWRRLTTRRAPRAPLRKSVESMEVSQSNRALAPVRAVAGAQTLRPPTGHRQPAEAGPRGRRKQ